MLTLDDITFKTPVAAQNPHTVNKSLLCYSVGFTRSHSRTVSSVTTAILCCYERNNYYAHFIICKVTTNGTGCLCKTINILARSNKSFRKHAFRLYYFQILYETLNIPENMRTRWCRPIIILLICYYLIVYFAKYRKIHLT